MKINKKVLIFAFLIILMVLVRVVLLPQPGLGYDMGYWFGWSKSIKDFGLINVYEQYYTDYVNYPPILMYFLWLLAKVYTFLGGLWDDPSTLFYILVKIPGVVFDVITSCFIFFLARKEFKLTFKRALLFFVLFAFNPITFYNSSFWGQVDVIHSFCMLLCLFLLYKKKYLPMWVVFGVSAVMKLQVIAILPILGFVTLYKKGVLRTTKYVMVSVLSFLLAMIVFVIAGKLAIVLNMYYDLYHGNNWAFEFGAHNVWWIVSQNNLDEGLFTVNDVKPFVNLIYFLYMLLLLLANFYRLKGHRLFLIGAMFCMAFFSFPIGVHERYLYPFFLLILVYAMKKRKYLKYYIGMSIIFLFNMMQTLKPPIFTEFFVKLMEPPVFGNILSFVNIFLLIVLSYQVFKGARKIKKKDLFSFWKGKKEFQ